MAGSGPGELLSLTRQVTYEDEEMRENMESDVKVVTQLSTAISYVLRMEITTLNSAASLHQKGHYCAGNSLHIGR